MSISRAVVNKTEKFRKYDIENLWTLLVFSLRCYVLRNNFHYILMFFTKL